MLYFVIPVYCNSLNCSLRTLSKYDSFSQRKKRLKWTQQNFWIIRIAMPLHIAMWPIQSCKINGNGKSTIIYNRKKILYTAWNTVYIFSSETVYKGCILHCMFFDVKAYTYREKYSHNQHT